MAKSIRCLITAGPTREYFDPVRFISNPSSGKMGYALAEVAVAQGWCVDLVSGPVALTPPAGATTHKVVTSKDMFDVVERLFPQCDLLIMSAAVCDMRPKQVAGNKVKKNALSMTIEMEPTTDILKTISARKQAGQKLVGFAAETEAIEVYAQSKLRQKNLDWIVANQVGGENNAFESEHNTVYLLGKGGERMVLGPASKAHIAQDLIQSLVEADFQEF